MFVVSMTEEHYILFIECSNKTKGEEEMKNNNDSEQLNIDNIINFVFYYLERDLLVSIELVDEDMLLINGIECKCLVISDFRCRLGQAIEWQTYGIGAKGRSRLLSSSICNLVLDNGESFWFSMEWIGECKQECFGI